MTGSSSQDHPGDALRALAQRQADGVEPDQEQSAPDEVARSESDVVEAFAEDPGQQQASGPAGASLQPPQAGKSALRAARMRQASRSQATQLKSFMVPMLLVVGGLLIVLGSLGAYLIWSPSSGAQIGGGAWTKVAVIVAFPLAAVLLLGAWAFRRDIAKSPKQAKP